jgi:hypothetical protein
MFHAREKKPRIAQNSPLIKNLKNLKNLKAKKNHLNNDPTPKTTTPRNQRSKNKSHILKLMIFVYSSYTSKRKIMVS